MRTAEVFLKAAERIESGANTMCCFAIEGACKDLRIARVSKTYEAADKLFRELYSPFRFVYDESTGAEFWSKTPTPRRQKQRVIALLLAAQASV